MTTRSRSRSITGYESWTNPDSTRAYPGITKETMTESSRPGGNQVRHSKWEMAPSVSTFGGRVYTIDFPAFTTEDVLGHKKVAFAAHAARSLDWSALPSSSAFGIIQFFAELDDTLATFTSKFWKQLSYGSFTWGVLPLVNDVKALAETVANLSQSLDRFPIEFGNTVPITSDTSHPSIHLNSGAATFRCTGFGALPQVGVANQLNLLLDRIGLHPDINTAWDLVPLSFVVDYILPIGPMLDAMNPRGWVQSMDFTGWSSLKIEVETKYYGALYQGQPYNGTVKFKHYGRDWSTIQLYQPPSMYQPPSFKLPSVTQLFNMLYLAKQML